MAHQNSFSISNPRYECAPVLPCSRISVGTELFHDPFVPSAKRPPVVPSFDRSLPILGKTSTLTVTPCKFLTCLPSRRAKRSAERRMQGAAMKWQYGLALCESMPQVAQERGESVVLGSSVSAKCLCKNIQAQVMLFVVAIHGNSVEEECPSRHASQGFCSYVLSQGWLPCVLGASFHITCGVLMSSAHL